MENDWLPWFWLGAGVFLLIGEMATWSFFMLPFAVGALVAAGLGFVGVPVAGQLVACAVISTAAFVAMRPLARRLNRGGQVDGIGASRLVGAGGTVIEDIPSDDIGLVRIEREEWRATSVDGQPIPHGSRVRVLQLEGTRVVVQPFEAPVPDLPAGD